MRDLLWYDPSTPPEEPIVEPDPVRRAQAAMRKDLPKRFWKDVAVEVVANGHRILLDGRPVRTPGKRELVMPRPELAEGIAAEWRAQATYLDPSTMPLTRLANSVVDGVVDRRAEVAADAAKYAATDLVCYRADAPERLVERQTAAWDPVLDWIEETLGARFLVGEGVIHVAQEAEALKAVAAAVEAFEPWSLAGLHTVTTLTGSVLIGLRLAAGRMSPDEAWTAAHVDELWSLELWGADEEAEARLAARRREFDAAVLFLGR
jgi:chaperone required for assembly of F1-ATPase